MLQQSSDLLDLPSTPDGETAQAMVAAAFFSSRLGSVSIALFMCVSISANKHHIGQVRECHSPNIIHRGWHRPQAVTSLALCQRPPLTRHGHVQGLGELHAVLHPPPLSPRGWQLHAGNLQGEVRQTDSVRGVA